MHRVMIPPHAVRGTRLAITDPRALHHLRPRPAREGGRPLECFDGQSTSCTGPIIGWSRWQLVVAIEGERREAPPVCRVTLAQALIKPPRFEWVIQKATELGVDRIVPMVTARVVARPSPGGRPRMPGAS